MMNEIAKGILLKKLKAQFTVPGHCGMVTPELDFEETAKLIETPRGSEHCAKCNLPTLDLLTALKSEAPDNWHIEEPEVELANPDTVILAGSYTDAKITVDGTNGAHIIMLHGAGAKVIAKDRAVVVIDRAADTKLEIVKKESEAFINDNHYEQKRKC